VYQYGLARASALARLVAKIVGLGSGNAERGIAYMRRVLRREISRGSRRAGCSPPRWCSRRRARSGAAAALERDARHEAARMASRYPGNPVFQRFLRETAGAAP